MIRKIWGITSVGSKKISTKGLSAIKDYRVDNHIKKIMKKQS